MPHASAKVENGAFTDEPIFEITLTILGAFSGQIEHYKARRASGGTGTQSTSPFSVPVVTAAERQLRPQLWRFDDSDERKNLTISAEASGPLGSV